MQTQSGIRVPVLTNSQQGLLNVAVSKSALPIEEVATQSEDARTLIQAGLLRLVVVMNPWGLDYELTPTSLGNQVIEQLVRTGGDAH